MGLHLCGPIKEFYLNLSLLLGPSKKKIIANGKKEYLACHRIFAKRFETDGNGACLHCICSIQMCGVLYVKIHILIAKY